MGTPTLTVMGGPERVVAFVFGAFCVHGVHVCMACMCAWRCALPAWRPTNTKLHPILENGTAIFWRSCANLFWFFFLCCIQLSTTSRKFTPRSYSLLHLFRITSAVLWRCFIASALPGAASALLRRCFGVASAFVWRSFGFGGVRCNFGATSVPPRVNLGATMRSAQPNPPSQLL